MHSTGPHCIRHHGRKESVKITIQQRHECEMAGRRSRHFEAVSIGRPYRGSFTRFFTNMARQCCNGVGSRKGTKPGVVYRRPIFFESEKRGRGRVSDRDGNRYGRRRGSVITAPGLLQGPFVRVRSFQPRSVGRHIHFRIIHAFAALPAPLTEPRKDKSGDRRAEGIFLQVGDKSIKGRHRCVQPNGRRRTGHGFIPRDPSHARIGVIVIPVGGGIEIELDYELSFPVY